VAIVIGAIRNMLDMARCQAALERRDAQEQKIETLLAKLSDNSYDTQSVKLRDENTGQQIKF
jgi:hypothetical protein